MTQRRADVDVVRCLALLAMYVAHVAPGAEPGTLLGLSDFVAMPLFAALVGLGAELGARAPSKVELPQRGGPAWWRSTVVRAVALIGLGLALDTLGAQVVIVLVHLGVLVLLADPLARLGTGAVTAVTVGVGLLTPWLAHRAAVHGTPYDTWWGDVQVFAWAGGPYRLGTMLCFAGTGILLGRWWVTGAHSGSPVLPAVGGLAAASAATALLAADRAGAVDPVAYSGTWTETAFDVLLVVAVTGAGLAAARLSVRAGVVRLAAAAGSMTLTLYCLHVTWLALDARVLHPGQRDESWTNLAVLVVGSLLVAAAWHVVVRRGPWRRGPLEGVVGLLAGRR